mmetsp:Transcript_1173/g.1684  ORF Transcript_1173/g.1684 Transcript_1173/m.1684 type:complete len:293 (-) Transcript_1173:36-914(-)
MGAATRNLRVAAVSILAVLGSCVEPHGSRDDESRTPAMLSSRHLTQGLRGGGLLDVDDDGRGAGGDEDVDPEDAPEKTGSKIPRILHFLWKSDELPRFSVGYKRTWLKHHPGWRVMQWTDNSMLVFVRKFFPGDEAMWHSFPTGVFRADTFRYMVLRVVGGVYADLDMESLRPIDPLLEGHTCLLGQEPSAHALLLVNKPRHICNAWMASAVGEPFWDYVLEEVRRRARSVEMSRWNPPVVTGPEMLTHVLARVGHGSPGGCGLVDPPEVLYPGVDKAGSRAKDQPRASSCI